MSAKNQPPYTTNKFLVDSAPSLQPIRLSDHLDLWESLTARQMRIAHMIADHKDDLEIARELHLGVDTVQIDIQRIFQKLDIDSQAMLSEVTAWIID